jgi:hypothetical protein
MTNVIITIGDTIRHRKRGSRYRILSRIHQSVDRIEDGGRYWIAGSMPAIAQPGHGIADAPGLGAKMGDEPISRLPVMAQIDAETRASALASGRIRIPFFIYESLDHPGQWFMRPLSEFTSDRFERLTEPGAVTWLVQSLLPEEQIQLVRDHDAIAQGAAAQGTSLQALVADFIGDVTSQPDHAQHMMDQIAATARAEQGGDERRMHISLSPQERAAVEELSGIQDLSPEAVIRQALRLYQAKVRGFEPGPPMGCMGD